MVGLTVTFHPSPLTTAAPDSRGLTCETHNSPKYKLRLLFFFFFTPSRNPVFLEGGDDRSSKHD